MTYTPDRSAPLLPIDEFRRIMGFNPWHFWQLAGGIVPITSHCNSLVLQYAWQNDDAVGRADIIEALFAAEAKLRAHLKFSPAPAPEADELQFPQFFDPRNSYLSSADAKGRWLSIDVRQRHVRTLGAMTLTSIGDANVTLQDLDNDGLNETFTLSIATSITDPEQLAAYFVSADRYDGSAVSERWRVQPVSVTISGGTATITGRTWTIARPVLHEGAAVTQLDPTSPASYASTLTVARRAVDTTQQGELLWETSPGSGCGGCTAVNDSLDPSGYTTLPARWIIRNAEIGTVAGEAAYYDATNDDWIANGWPVAYAPERARINYVAGYPSDNGQMAERMKIIVARLAAAELARPICGCTVANRELSRWQFDLASTGGTENAETYTLGFDDLQNPFGTRRGHVYAWRQVQELWVRRAVTI
jgi:hypothetical protein